MKWLHGDLCATKVAESNWGFGGTMLSVLSAEHSDVRRGLDHGDPGVVTVLLPNQAPGLQVKHEEYTARSYERSKCTSEFSNILHKLFLCNYIISRIILCILNLFIYLFFKISIEI